MNLFSGLPAVQDDAIIALMQAFRDDPRPEKIDLGVGVWRDEAGRTPPMRAVRAAEARLAAREEDRGYTALAGEPAFRGAIRDLVLGGAVPAARCATLATVGGSGALAMACRLIAGARPGARLWLPVPTWPNHAPIAAHAGLATTPYRYYDAGSGEVDADGLLADLGGLAAGDVVLLHGCCHNPTGADPDAVLWAAIAARIGAAGARPLIDLAYPGLADGLEADLAPTRMLAARLPEALIAVSGSKSFGLYRERAGALIAVAGDEAGAGRAMGELTRLNRVSYSFPPDHGARLVTEVLGDQALRAEWEAELAEMRARLTGLRAALSRALSEAAGSDRHGAIAAQRGMFSTLPLDAAALARLREQHAIYAVPGGRINLAGLTEGTVPRAARALVAAGL